MSAAVNLSGVSARDIRIEKIQSIYNIAAAPPAFSYRGIAGIPPPTDERMIQQRTPLVEAIYTKLTQPGINTLVLTGLGGVGKSTLAALLSQYTEAQSSTRKGFFQAPPLWLSIDKAATFADVIGTIFQQLDKPISILDNLSPSGQVGALFTLLDTLALPRLIVLDQFDNLLDWATGEALPTQPGVGEWVDALNSHPLRANCRLLLTSRPFPKGTQVVPPLCFQDYAVGGLTSEEGLALFHLRGIQAPEADLQRAVAFCDGHLLSLVLLIALIQFYGISLIDLLAEPTLWIGDIATNLLDVVFHRLAEEQRAVLRALSVYRMAVPIAALSPFLVGVSQQQILLSLKPLLVQQLVQPTRNRSYQVHRVVGRYTQTHFVEGDQQANKQALRAAHATAAYYYLEQAQDTILPREQRRGVNDIKGIIEIAWQYTQAAQWPEAYALIEQENLLNDLSVWGGYILLLTLCQWFLPQPEWQPKPEQAIIIYLFLGSAESHLGKKPQALEYYQQALNICCKVGDRWGQGATLNNIGEIYEALGDKALALQYYQQALSICREVGNRWGEFRTLNNIGGVYSTLGNKQQALQYYQQALNICHEAGDRWGEGLLLNNIGSAYDALGKKKQALEYYQQALRVHREIGNRWSEGTTLNNTGFVYDALGKKKQALEYYQQALAIQREVGDRGGEGSILNNIGRVYDALDNKKQALQYYQQALSIFQKIGDREGEGNTQWNIGVLALAQHHYDFALAALLIAKQRFKEVSSPEQNGVESWIDYIRQTIGQQQFAALQEFVEPQLQQIVEQGLSAKQAKYEVE